jgi:hypothetical protein
MLSDLKHIGCAFLPDTREDDWDLLARAQHFGMATRLLDWTSNPLAALWFASRDLDTKRSGFVYFYTPTPIDISQDRNTSPFFIQRTSVFRPTWNNPRITAQCGWFTVHGFDPTTKSFVPVGSDAYAKRSVDCWEIAGDDKHVIVDDLDQLGVNYQTMFPDLEGVCRHLNWIHDYT